MSTAVIALVLLGHGIGHSMGLLQVFKVASVSPKWNGDSWVLTPAAGTTVTRVVAVLLWTVALVGFTTLAAVAVGWLPEAWWMPLAVGSSIASLAGLLLFPIAFPVFSTIGAFVVNVAVLAGVLLYEWTPIT